MRLLTHQLELPQLKKRRERVSARHGYRLDPLSYGASPTAAYGALNRNAPGEYPAKTGPPEIHQFQPAETNSNFRSR